MKNYEPIHKGKANQHTMTAAARYLGITLGRLGYLIDAGDVPKGELAIGRRRYYTTEQLEKIKSELDEERRRKIERRVTNKMKG